MRSAMLTLAFLAFMNLCEAKTVTLETGNWFVDTNRTVEVDQFDYIYTLKSVHLGGYFIELDEGSVWQVEELSPEAKSFYKGSGLSLEDEFVENVVAFWQAGDHLIFHKVIDRETVLIYNIEQDQLFDFVPLSPPVQPLLTVAAIDLVNRQLSLSDGSVWAFAKLCQCKQWGVGDPITVAKDTPWQKVNTHILINLKYCECDASKGHIHPNRLGVHRVP